jgi:aminomethyltransferase
MPVQYEGIGAEHKAVRRSAGVFDVSHMGQLVTEGPEAEAFLQRLLSNDLTRLSEGGAQYSLLCREDGGVLDDLFSYRLGPERYLTVTNASNHERDLAWMAEHSEGFDVEVRDARDEWAMLAVQGPAARAAVEGLSDGELPARMRTATLRVAGQQALVCGTGYTGEDGVEVLLAPDGAEALWDALVDAGVTPAGLGARDTLRLEVCFPLYGNDLSEERNPIEAGLGWACKPQTGFIGSEALAGETRDLLVPFAFTGPGIPRQGNPVRTAAGDGVVTSGTMSPCLEQGIGMAYLPRAAAEPGTPIEVDVRGKARAAEVRQKPLYRRGPAGDAGGAGRAGPPSEQTSDSEE